MKEFSVSQLVGLDNQLGLKLIAGAQNAGNLITGVNIMDNPDTFDWLTAGEFVLTTGYLFQNDVGMQCQIIRELAEINCAGIGIKVKRYLEQVPECMLQEANRVGLPVVEIPFQNTLSHVLNVINREIGEQDNLIFKKYVHIHNTITQCTLQGGSLRQLTQLSSSLIGNPLLVVDEKWHLMAWWEREDNPKPMDSFVRLQKGEIPFSQEFIETIPENMEQYTHIIKRTYPRSSIVCRVMPVTANDILYGFIIVWETVRKMTSLDYMALEMAATSVALEQLKEKQIQEIKHSLRQDFFDDLLEGKIESVSAVKSLAEIHYMDAAKTYICMVVKLNVESSASGAVQAMRELLQIKKSAMALIETAAHRQNRSIVAIQRGNLIIAFLLAEKEESEQISEDTRALLESLYSQLEERYPSVEIGVGNPCPDFLNMRKSYLNALEAMELSEKMGGQTKLTFYADMIVYHLLGLVQPREQLEEFFNHVLGRLQKYDQENKADLMSTLEEYFLNGGNITLAAKKKYLHRNTFMYRIEKIKDILKVDFKHPESVLELQIALKIRKILDQ